MSFLTDSSASAHVITLVGNASQSSAQSVFDSSSLKLTTGANRWASSPDSNDWAFGANPFTVELHARFTTVTAAWTLIGQFDNTSQYWSFYKYDDGSPTGRLVFAYTTGGGSYQSVNCAAPALVAGQWYHFAVDRDGANDFRLYLDGAVLVTTNLTTPFAASTYTLSIGGMARRALDLGDYSGDYDLDGYIDEVRITKGVARYAGTFTPPSAAYPNDLTGDPSFASVVLLAHFDDTVVVDGVVLAPLAAEGWVEFPTYGAVALPLLAVDGTINRNLGAAVLPQLTMAGTALRTYPMNGDAFLPEIDSAGSLEPALAWPALLLAATGYAGNVLDGAVALPKLAGAGSLEAALKLPPLTVDGTLLGGAAIAGDVQLAMLDSAGSLEAALPLPQLQSDGVLAAGNLAHGAALLEALDAQGVFGTAGSAELAPLTLSALALAGQRGLADAALARLTLDAVLYQNNTLDGAASIEPFSAHGVAASTAVIDGDARLSPASLTADMLSGNITTVVSLELPLLAVDADGHASQIGSATVRLPLLRLDATMVADVAAPLFAGVVLHTRAANAVTTYSGADFNSLCSFNGVLLAASSSGLYALTGDTDAGVPIAAVLASGVADFQSEQFKRVLCGYAGYSAAGDLELTITTDGHQQYVYALAPRRPGVLHAARVKFGRGVDGRYWQWRLSNRAGAAFALDALTLDAVALSRRIG